MPREATAIPMAKRACIPARLTDMTTAANPEATPRAERPAFTVAEAEGSAADMAAEVVVAATPAVAGTTKNLSLT